MIKTIPLVFLVMCLTTKLSFAQTSYLHLEKRSSSKIKSISNGSLSLIFSKVITYSGKKYVGKLKIIDSLNIAIQNDTLSILEIERICIKPIISVIGGGVIGGAGLLLAGTTSAFIFIAFIPRINLRLILLNQYTLAGVGIATLGAVAFLINRTYEKSKWDITINDYK